MASNTPRASSRGARNGTPAMACARCSSSVRAMGTRRQRQDLAMPRWNSGGNPHSANSDAISCVSCAPRVCVMRRGSASSDIVLARFAEASSVIDPCRARAGECPLGPAEGRGVRKSVLACFARLCREQRCDRVRARVRVCAHQHLTETKRSNENGPNVGVERVAARFVLPVQRPYGGGDGGAFCAAILAANASYPAAGSTPNRRIISRPTS